MKRQFSSRLLVGLFALLLLCGAGGTAGWTIMRPFFNLGSLGSPPTATPRPASAASAATPASGGIVTIVGAPVTATFTATPTNTATATPTPSQTASPSPTPSTTPTFTPTPPPTATPTAEPSEPSGEIVFTCFINQIDQICRVNADGSGYTQLSGAALTSFYPSLAPDGSQIVFSSRRSGNFEIYRMDRNGQNIEQLSANLGGLYAPEISPDGRLLVFTAASNNRQAIWVMDLLTRQSQPLVEMGVNSLDPTWSPDGRQIAFASDMDGRMRHYIINLDGSGLRALPGEDNISDIGGRSAWSPNGEWLAIYAGPRNRRDIYLVAVNGAETRRLTDGGGNLAPSFSPDGQWLVFTSYRSNNSAELFLMRTDGSDLRQLTFNNYADWQPRWRPSP